MRLNLSAIILLGHIAKGRALLPLRAGYLAKERFGVRLMKMVLSTADERPSQGTCTRKRAMTKEDDGDSVFFRLPQVRITFLSLLLSECVHTLR